MCLCPQVLLFGVIDSEHKDEVGTYSTHPDNPVIRASKLIREAYPSLTVICDVS